MSSTAATAEARNIMIDFADQTGLSSTQHPPRRYLWTDAHAVCNFLSLYRRTQDKEYKQLALSLIEQVHAILGRHREDDPRRGWISGLSEEAGREHPTAGGLRIGKKLNERAIDEVFDDRLEWDRDGQYFHYLTKWMHALSRAAAVTGERVYCRWAVELAKAAHAGFSRKDPDSGRKRLLWKMSIDLSRPLVPSTGLHDSLDAYITYNELGPCSERIATDRTSADLEEEIVETAEMIAGRRWHTDDPLGLGGLLFDAGRVFQLTAAAHLDAASIAVSLLRAACESLAYVAGQMSWSHPAEYRLAFRELGLSIGLHAVGSMQEIARTRPELFGNGLEYFLDDLGKYIPLRESIEDFWRTPGNQQAETWRDHLDINRVMLATSLVPDEFLAI